MKSSIHMVTELETEFYHAPSERLPKQENKDGNDDDDPRLLHARYSIPHHGPRLCILLQ